MKKIIHLSVMAFALAAFSLNSFGGSCGSCPGEEGDGKKKDKDQTEQGSAS